MLNSKQSCDVYIEPYKTIKININPSVNQTGVLYVDEYNNALYSIINLGINRVLSIVGYSANYPNSLLIYSGESYGLYKDFITPNKFAPIIHPNNPVQYKINATKTQVDNADDSPTFAIGLTGRTIFKVKLNGIETTNYSATVTSITVNDTKLLAPFENTLEVIHYTTNQTITQPFYLTYYGVEKRYDLEVATCEPTFFDNMKSITLFQDMSDSINKTLVDVGNSVENSQNKIITGLDDQITLAMYSGTYDLVAETMDKPFRIVSYDMMNDILTYWSGCRIFNGVNFTMGDVNIKNYTINFDDKVEVYGVSPVNVYGEGLYGEGYYGVRVVSSNYGATVY